MVTKCVPPGAFFVSLTREMDIVAGITARDRELPVRNTGSVDQIESLVPEVESVLKPFRGHVLVATVLVAKWGRTKEARGSSETYNSLQHVSIFN